MYRLHVVPGTHIRNDIFTFEAGVLIIYLPNNTLCGSTISTYVATCTTVHHTVSAQHPPPEIVRVRVYV